MDIDQQQITRRKAMSVDFGVTFRRSCGPCSTALWVRRSLWDIPIVFFWAFNENKL